MGGDGCGDGGTPERCGAALGGVIASPWGLGDAVAPMGATMALRKPRHHMGTCGDIKGFSCGSTQNKIWVAGRGGGGRMSHMEDVGTWKGSGAVQNGPKPAESQCSHGTGRCRKAA